MADYTVWRHPRRAQYRAVKAGFSFGMAAMNLLLLGWVWAIAGGAWRFGIRLALLTLGYAAVVATVVPAVLGPGLAPLLLAHAFWLLFSLMVALLAATRIEHALGRRGWHRIEKVPGVMLASTAIARAAARG